MQSGPVIGRQHALSCDAMASLNQGVHSTARHSTAHSEMTVNPYTSILPPQNTHILQHMP
jgi:hypothetical protein